MGMRSAVLGAVTCTVVLVVAGTAAGFGTFKPAQTTAMSGIVYQVDVGDINRDGLGDVAAANGEGSDDHVEIRLARRNGSFRAPKKLIAGDDPDGVAIARLNGDKRPDVAVANYSDNDVSVFLQRRNGSFRKAAEDLPGGPGNWQVEIADLNRDGHNDIVTINYSNAAPDDVISVHLGKKRGFKPVTSYPGGGGGLGVEIGRLNGDKRPDVVASSTDGIVSPYLTRRDGTLKVGNAVDLGSATSFSPLALGDFTGEGKLDVVVADYDSGSLTMLRGNGKGKLAAMMVPTPAVPSVNGIASGNLNGRGGVDLAVNLLGEGKVQVLRGTGNGILKLGPSYDLSDDPQSIAVGRVGKDRGFDILVGTDSSLDTFINKR